MFSGKMPPSIPGDILGRHSFTLVWAHRFVKKKTNKPGHKKKALNAVPNAFSLKPNSLIPSY
ncbi:MAG: hypothetical protein D6714_21210 [Bacteroidetes bacterium]|nr:MAG: hypothetical protein D6714_21210 [Bacteroidota bacterium]